MLLAVLETYFLQTLMSAISSTASIPVCYVVISPKNIFIYESDMALLVSSGKLSYELLSQRSNIYYVPSNIMIIWWLAFLEAWSSQTKPGEENWKIWKEWREGIGVLPPKLGGIMGSTVIPALCVPMLQQGLSRKQNLEQGSYWQLLLILLYMPDVIFFISGSHRGCLGRACKLFEAVPGLLHSDLCPQTLCVH